MDLSLDELWESDKPKPKTRSTRGRGRGRGRGGLARGRGRGRGVNASSRAIRRPAARQKPAQQTGIVTRRAQNLKSKGIVTGAKVLVSNLLPDVNAEDVSEIFSRLGKIKKAFVMFDDKGTSLGTAQVTYYRQEDAMKAVKEYDGLKVDGRPMTIEIIQSPNVAVIPEAGAPAKSNQTRSTTNTQGRGRDRTTERTTRTRRANVNPLSRDNDEDVEHYDTSFGGGRSKSSIFGSALNGKSQSQGARKPRGRRGRGGARGRGRTEQPAVSAEDLDAEMEEYFQS